MREARPFPPGRMGWGNGAGLSKSLPPPDLLWGLGSDLSFICLVAPTVAAAPKTWKKPKEESQAAEEGLEAGPEEVRVLFPQGSSVGASCAQLGWVLGRGRG